MNQLTKILFLTLLSSVCCHAQMEKYRYQRPLTGIMDQWHKIELTDAIFEKTQNNLHDIRIYGVTNDGDTVEAPYVMKIAADEINTTMADFQIINRTSNAAGYYYTFEVPTRETVNEIKLEFSNKNFDWNIQLEGSQDQSSWFTVLDNYRILSIKNAQTDFQFTDLVFSPTKYRYYRLLIKSKKRPALTVTSIAQNETKAGNYRDYGEKTTSVSENKQTKATVLDLAYKRPIRPSRLKLSVADDFYYYRPVTVKYLADSFNTEQGWQYQWRALASGAIHSLGKTEFSFPGTTLKRLKIFIENGDNQPLKIDSVEVKGYVHELHARFTEQATYYLAYGNETARRPSYDIERSASVIPESMTALVMGEETIRVEAEAQIAAPLFESELWLWGVMIVIIAVLGWFSVKMISNKQ